MAKIAQQMCYNTARAPIFHVSRIRLNDLLLILFTLAIGVALAVALGWWLFIQTEGVYLGQRVVRFLYDQSAYQYDDIKEFDEDSDDERLGGPLAERLASHEDAWVLDVATGTARLPLSLLRHVDFQGRIVALDVSPKMLEVAQAKTAVFAESLTLIHNDARPLPFADASFAAVTCIEALEFLPNVSEALREMVRVLKPHGTLVVTNRCGFDRWTFPARSYAPAAFERWLHELGLHQIHTERWLVYYDLIYASKKG
jgi:ubiquinone/menaquinone biosynthesis C-methylase UbiE